MVIMRLFYLVFISGVLLAKRTISRSQEFSESLDALGVTMGVYTTPWIEYPPISNTERANLMYQLANSELNFKLFHSGELTVTGDRSEECECIAKDVVVGAGGKLILGLWVDQSTSIDGIIANLQKVLSTPACRKVVIAIVVGNTPLDKNISPVTLKAWIVLIQDTFDIPTSTMLYLDQYVKYAFVGVVDFVYVLYDPAREGKALTSSFKGDPFAKEFKGLMDHPQIVGKRTLMASGWRSEGVGYKDSVWGVEEMTNFLLRFFGFSNKYNLFPIVYSAFDNIQLNDEHRYTGIMHLENNIAVPKEGIAKTLKLGDLYILAEQPPNNCEIDGLYDNTPFKLDSPGKVSLRKAITQGDDLTMKFYVVSDSRIEVFLHSVNETLSTEVAHTMFCFKSEPVAVSISGVAAHKGVLTVTSVDSSCVFVFLTTPLSASQEKEVKVYPPVAFKTVLIIVGVFCGVLCVVVSFCLLWITISLWCCCKNNRPESFFGESGNRYSKMCEVEY